MYRIATAAVLCWASAGFADDAGDIRRVLDEQASAWNKGNLEEFMAGYWNSKELTFMSGKDITRGWDETLARYKKRYQADGKEMGMLTFSDLEVRLLSPDAALVTGKFDLKLSTDSPSGRYTLVMRKFKDGWKIVHDHTSS